MTKGKPYKEKILFKTSLWEGVSEPSSTFKSLEGSHKADVVVIGAGVAGLSTAFHLARLGKSVAIVEAEEPGSGASGVSGGLIAPDFIRHKPSDIVDLLGKEWGDRLIDMVGSAAQQTFDFIKEQNISCDAAQDGFWTPAHDDVTVDMLKKRAQEWKERGFRVEFVENEKLGCSKYNGTLHFADGGSINPLAFCRELSGIAKKAGATIFCQSPVQNINRFHDKWRVETKKGYVEADKVVLAANGGNAALHPLMRKTTLPLKVIEYATAIETSSTLPEGTAFTDKKPYLFTARYDAEGRMIAALPDFSFPRSEKSLLKEARIRILQHFPSLSNVSIDYIWRGTAWLNASLLPKIYELEEGIFAIQACNGRGLANNVVLGKEMAKAIAQSNIALLSLQIEKSKPIKGYFIAQYIPSLMMAWAFIRSKL